MNLLYSLEQFDLANIKIDLRAYRTQHCLLLASRAVHFKSASYEALNHVVDLLLTGARLHGNDHVSKASTKTLRVGGLARDSLKKLLVYFQIKLGLARRC